MDQQRSFHLKKMPPNAHIQQSYPSYPLALSTQIGPEPIPLQHTSNIATAGN